MSLHTARCQFSDALVQLLSVRQPGIEFAVDQVTVPAEGSVHMKGSLHESGLAADILLYRNGVYLTDTKDYQAMGEYWEAIGQAKGLDLAWGGRFTKPDGNHFSMRYQGKA